jgi:hypothetical protein
MKTCVGSLASVRVTQEHLLKVVQSNMVIKQPMEESN